MSVLNRREYLRQPVGRSPVNEAINGVLRAMPIGGARSGVLGAAGAGDAIPGSGLVHDYDLRQVSGTDGDAIGTIPDQEGSADLTQSTSSKKPTLKTGSNGINNENVAQFDDTDDLIDGTFTNISPPYHIFVVGRRDEAGTTDDQETFYDGASADVARLFGDTDTGGNNSWTMFGGSRLQTGTEDDNDHIFTNMWDDSTSSINRVDGGATEATGDAGNIGALDGITMGARGDDDIYGGVSITRLLVYNKQLSDSKRDQAESALSDIYGVTLG